MRRMKRSALSAVMAFAGAVIASGALAVCDNCGTVTSVRMVKKEAPAQPVEKDKGGTTSYVVEVKLENGALRTFTYAAPTAYKMGDRVKIVAKKLVKQ